MRAVYVLVVVAGCGRVVDPGGGGGSTGEFSSSSTGAAGPNETSSSSGTTASGSGTSSGSIEPGTSSSGELSGDAESGCAFLCPEDTEGASSCSIWTQDCPPGEKCTPVDDEGNVDLDFSRCVPVVPEPAAVGESCVRPGPEGTDACEEGTVCWNIDFEDTEGSCTPLCTGTPDAPECLAPSNVCAQTGGGSFALCLALCDPLDPGSCDEGDGCYTVLGVFTCAPDNSGAAGGLFETCTSDSQCDPGSICDAGMCNTETDACCTPWCDLDAPNCPPGTGCQPFADGFAQPGFEHVGVCLRETP